MFCKIDGCEHPISGQSKYCKAHKEEARARFKEMLKQKEKDKLQRESEFQKIWDEAREAGEKKVQQAQLKMISVCGGEPFAICGFGWKNIKPGNSSFANWLKKNNYARADSYYGGVCIWVSDYGQSYDKKLACAEGMAGVFVNYNIKAYASGRLD